MPTHNTTLSSSMHAHTTLGWDVGGAHLKAVLIDAHGSVLQVLQLACPLWRGLNMLADAVREVLVALQPLEIQPLHHAVTMTGELADIFAYRKNGVMKIADLMSQLLPGRVKFYAGTTGFVAIADVTFHSSSIASANWLASASLLAQNLGEGLLVDIGSTTTDIAVLAHGKPQVRGYSDADRMQYQELVYTGAVRTPLMAITSSLPYAGDWVGLAAEHFATTADVYRLTGELDAAADLADTTDGAGKTLQESARRLARMLGRDAAEADMNSWITLAEAARQAQLASLQQAALRAISRQLLGDDAPLIGAGAGSFLVQRLAVLLQRPFINASSVIRSADQDLRQQAAVCFPAYAVAVLCLSVA